MRCFVWQCDGGGGGDCGGKIERNVLGTMVVRERTARVREKERERERERERAMS